MAQNNFPNIVYFFIYLPGVEGFGFELIIFANITALYVPNLDKNVSLAGFWLEKCDITLLSAY